MAKEEENANRGLGRLVGTVHRGVTEARAFGTDDETIGQWLEFVASQIRRGVYCDPISEVEASAPAAADGTSRQLPCSHPGAAGPCMPRVRDGRCIWCERVLFPNRSP